MSFRLLLSNTFVNSPFFDCPDTNHPDNTREVIKRLFDRNHGRMVETICALLRELTVFTLTWQNNQANSGAFSTGSNGGNSIPTGPAANSSANDANTAASSTTKRMGQHYETRIAQARYRNIVPNSAVPNTTAAFESGSDVPSSEDDAGTEGDDDGAPPDMRDYAARGMAPVTFTDSVCDDEDEGQIHGSSSSALADVSREIEKDMSKIIRQNLRKLQHIQGADDAGAGGEAASGYEQLLKYEEEQEQQLSSSSYFTKVGRAASDPGAP
jgi:hypothetical protein